MRIQVWIAIQSLIVTVATAAAWAGPVSAQDSSKTEMSQDSAAPSCDKECRGLGIEKVMAGEEHCGLIAKERKDESLAAACGLADSHREELQERAEERARGKCEEELDETACRCKTELRPWQNVYTHVLSKRCWTECGWAFLIECDREPEAKDG